MFYHETELKSQFFHFNLKLKSPKSIVIICSIHENNFLRFPLNYVTTEKPSQLNHENSGKLGSKIQAGRSLMEYSTKKTRNGWKSPWIPYAYW